MYNIKLNTNYEALDILRGLSAIIVFVAHIHQILIAPVYFNQTIATLVSFSSHYAVLTFFIISGFVIALSILKNITINGHFNIFSFIFDRMVRIYPALILSLLITYALFLLIQKLDLHGAISYGLPGDIGPLARDRFYFNPNEVIPTIIGTQYLSINGPLWSLVYEIHFYLLVSLFALLLAGKNLHQKIFGLFFLIIFLINKVNENSYIFWCYFVFWSVGAITLAFYVKYKSKLLYILVATFLLSVIIILLQYFIFGAETISTKSEAPHIYFQFGYILLLNSLIFLFQNYYKNINLTRLFYFLKKSSKYSYTLYICHFPLLLFALSLIHPLTKKGLWFYFLLSAFSSFIVFILCVFISRFTENKDLFKKFFYKLVKTVD